MAAQRHTRTSLDPITLRPKILDSVHVIKNDQTRFVICFCGERVKRSIVPHMKNEHASEWNSWVNIFLEMRRRGSTLKKIMRTFRSANDQLLFSWTVIDRAIRYAVERLNLQYVPPPILSVTNWEPSDFRLETSTIWDFPIRGAWAVHVGDYRGNWPPQLVRNIIQRYTSTGDLVLDPFMGGGTTLIEAWLLNRHSVGIDISKLAYQTVSDRLECMRSLSIKDSRANINATYTPRLVNADSTFDMNADAYECVQKGSVKLLCVHPPYLDALTYTGDRSEDLSQLRDPEVFLQRIAKFAHGSTAYLASENYCAVLIGDVRKNGSIVPLGARVLDVFLNVGFQLDDIIIKTQNRDRSSEFYLSSTKHHLLAHEYLYILKWPHPEKTR